MKKILEVIDYGNHDIRFNTDFREKDQGKIPEIISRIAFTMTTQLRGSTETEVIAMIRALAIADLALCVNRKQMIRSLDESSASFSKILRAALSALEKSGGGKVDLPPGWTSGKSVS